MTATDKLLELVKRKGPIVPSDVAKDINQNLLFTSAMLSELKSRNLVKISHLKVGGGSPLYYTPEQAKDLAKFIKYLDEKDQRAANALQDQKVMRDLELEPLMRVSLRQIKDFAVPLEVTFGESTEIFWKWYNASDEEAGKIINKMINGLSPQEVQEEVPKKIEEAQVVPKEELKKEPQIQEEPASEPKKVTKKKTAKKKVAKTDSKKEEMESQSKLDKDESEEKPKQSKKEKKPQGEFYSKVMEYFEENEIEILSEKQIRKSREYEFSLAVPSNVGLVEFICIARKKKSLSDGDLSSMYVNAQSHNKPILVVTDGSLAKKAQDLLKKQMKGLNIAHI